MVRKTARSSESLSSSHTFGDGYARIYDALYTDKDYAAECRYLQTLFRRFRPNGVKSVLDIACGTGGHAIPLARSGYNVRAQDISLSMVEIGKGKTDGTQLPIEWHAGLPMQRFSHRQRFDAVICLFSAIDYLLTDEDIHSTLLSVHKHLFADGLFLLDFWNHSAVERSLSPHREKACRIGPQAVRRTSDTCLDRKRRLATVSMHWAIEEDRRVVFSGEETHICRYFDIDEMRRHLVAARFDVLNMHPFLNPQSPIDQDTWNVTTVCRVL